VATIGRLGQRPGRPRPPAGPALGVDGPQPPLDPGRRRWRWGGQGLRRAVSRSAPKPSGVSSRRTRVSELVWAPRSGASGWPSGTATGTDPAVSRAASSASPLRPSSMASTARGMAAAMAWATRSLLAWATLPPMEAAVPQMTSSQP
jgi:hypothetical protein